MGLRKKKNRRKPQPKSANVSPRADRPHCTSGKTCHTTKKRALSSAAVNTTDDHQLYVYKCKLCHFWHLTKRGPLPHANT